MIQSALTFFCRSQQHLLKYRAEKGMHKLGINMAYKNVRDMCENYIYVLFCVFGVFA
jgi:hypothetical protein